jgi:hypothetical protein
MSRYRIGVALVGALPAQFSTPTLEFVGRAIPARMTARESRYVGTRAATQAATTEMHLEPMAAWSSRLNLGGAL